MANPFGSSDQTLSKNTGHTNADNLIRALVPRNTSKWVEVISGSTVTPGATGSYDADGYFFGPNSTTVATYYTLPANLSPASTFTIIAHCRHNGSGGASADQRVGLNDSGGTAQFRMGLDRYVRRARVEHYDSTSVSSGMNFSSVDPSSNDFGFGIKTTPGAQSGFVRVGTTDSTFTGSSSSLGGSATMNRLEANSATLYGVRFVFVYDAALSDANIRSILDDPGAVLSQAGAAPALTGSSFSSLAGTLPPTIAVPL